MTRGGPPRCRRLRRVAALALLAALAGCGWGGADGGPAPTTDAAAALPAPEPIQPAALPAAAPALEAAGPRVERIAAATGARGADLDGDRRSDIVWRNDAGTVVGWIMDGTSIRATGAIGSAGPEWRIASADGDYDGDGRTDLLWRNAEGVPAVWLLQGLSIRATGVLPAVPPNWQLVAGGGDYDGDRRSDILWRNEVGTVAIWSMDGAAVTRVSFPATVPLEWSIVEANGDYDGDGRSDILWRSSAGTVAIWLMGPSGVPQTRFLPTVGPEWTLLSGAGDHNGDGRSDIVWKHTSGTVYLWTMNGASIASAGVVGSVSPEWQLVGGAGDYDGDGRSDLLWRSAAGTVAIWRMDGASVAASAFVATVGPEWRVVGETGAAGSSYTVSGVLSFAETATVDSDTNDVNQPGWRGNDTLATAQAVPNPATVVGYVNLRNQGPPGRNFGVGDTDDVFRVALQAGQVIELEFASDPSAIDLDLFVFDAGRALVGYSIGTNRYECVRVAAAGTYHVAVSIYDGSTGGSNYTLRIAAPGSSASCANQTAAADAGLIDGEVIASVAARAAARSPKSLEADSGGAVLAKGSLAARELALLRLPETAAARIAALRTVSVRAAGHHGKSAAALPVVADTPLHAGLGPDAQRLLETIQYAKRLAQTGDYAYAVPNTRVEAFQTAPLVGALPPDDPLYAVQRWHYEQIGLPAAMDALRALPVQPGVRPVVAVIDSGIVADHPDLAGQLIGGYDFVSNLQLAYDGDGPDPDPNDPQPEATRPRYHGTHVAGTVAARTFNGTGVAGVAPMARVMPLRALSWSSRDQNVVGSTFDIAEAMRHAGGLATATPGVAAPPRRADVVNMSLGGQRACDEPYRSIVTDLLARDVLVVAAAGNGGGAPVASPANCPGVIAVSATDARRGLARYSNRGPEVAVAAPGGDTGVSTTGNGQPDGVFSTVAQFVDGVRRPSYGHLQGTSMAAPHVAGVIALMRWVNPSITQAQVRNLLAAGVLTDEIGPPGRDDSFGHGLINARKAVDAARATLGGTTGPTGQVEASPTALDLGATRSEATLVFRRVGDSDEHINRISWTPNLLTVLANPGDYDPATLLGSFAVRAHRDALAPGTSAFPQVVATTSAGRTITVQVAMERRPAGQAYGDFGPIYVIAVDADDPAGRSVAQATVSAATNGVYRYTMTVPGTRRIGLLAGTDPDNDDFICDTGEVCGGYPVLGQGRVLEPTGSLTGIDFAVAPLGSIGAAALDGQGPPSTIVPRPKRVGAGIR